MTERRRFRQDYAGDVSSHHYYSAACTRLRALYVYPGCVVGSPFLRVGWALMGSSAWLHSGYRWAMAWVRLRFERLDAGLVGGDVCRLDYSRSR